MRHIPRFWSLTAHSTFALAFWVAFQMYMLMEIDSPEPLIVYVLPPDPGSREIGNSLWLYV